MGEVTGIDYVVQAAVVSRYETADLLWYALLRIESEPYDLHVGCFCGGGVHRSPAVATLVTMLAYPLGAIMFHKRRTHRAAVARGWQQYEWWGDALVPR